MVKTNNTPIISKARMTGHRSASANQSIQNGQILSF